MLKENKRNINSIMHSKGEGKDSLMKWAKMKNKL